MIFVGLGKSRWLSEGAWCLLQLSNSSGHYHSERCQSHR